MTRISSDDSEVVPPLVDLRRRHSSSALRARVLSGSMMMLISSGLVGAMNLAYNLAIAHHLGAASFGHATAVYTLLMLLSAVTLSFQLLCSKLVPQNDRFEEKAEIYRLLHRRSWLFGFGISSLLLLSSGVLSSYLQLPTKQFIMLLSIGTTFYIPLGVRRGLMQGMYDFFHLGLNYVMEVVVKLAGTLLLIHMGFGVPGVIVAVVASIVVSYLIALPPRELRTSKIKMGVILTFGEGLQAAVFFIGQVIINNLDIALVKHFFSATEAGVYAAIALVGRVVYMLSWSVVSSMFPVSAGASGRDRDGRAVLSMTLLLVVSITSLFTLGVGLAPPRWWHIVLGAGFPLGSQSRYSALLVLYAATTGIYSLCVVLMSYEISRKIGNVSWLQLGFSGAIIVGIYMFHNRLQTVITVQLVLMLLLMILVSIPFLRVKDGGKGREEHLETHESSLIPLRKLRRVPESHVISEFLRSEFFQPEFVRYRERFERVVMHPDLSNEQENVVRKALLFKRRGRLWRELPEDTEWWEVELQPSDLHRIRVFPRSQWRKVADDSYYLEDMTERIAAKVESDPHDTFVVKLRAVCRDLAAGIQQSAILMIGVDDKSPLTIIEGNHRMAAANLLAPMEVPPHFRFLCGFSPRMTECCWYQTDLSTLWRYGKNTLTFFFEDPDGVIAKTMPSILEGATSDSSIGAA